MDGGVTSAAGVWDNMIAVIIVATHCGGEGWVFIVYGCLIMTSIENNIMITTNLKD